MAKSDLLKEAIADAKAVKETALANAKIALQEAFAPRIQNMLSAKLSEDLEDENIDDELLSAGMYTEQGDDADEMSLGDDPEMGADPEMGDEMGTDVGDLSIDMDGDGEMDFEGDIYSKQEPGGEMEPEAEMEDEMSDEEAEGEYTDDDVDGLSEIIAELEMEDEPEAMMADHAGDGSGTDSDAPDPEDELGESIDDIINEILDEEYEDEDPIAEDIEAGSDGADGEPVEELAEALEALEESYKTVHHLKSVINEVNLLNAKLLYTNKLFRSFELTEPQKMKVIENFDRAKTTRETKLVFTTLAESFKKPTKKRIVKESYASRPSTSTAPSKKFKENTQILSEGFEHANRWKKLAGLI